VHAVVVFESLWGNTEQLMRELAAGIGEGTEVVEAGSAPSFLAPDGALLVVGGPTHAFSTSTQSTRESAKQQGATGVRPAESASGLKRRPPPAVRFRWRHSTAGRQPSTPGIGCEEGDEAARKSWFPAPRKA
jgi:hypothetical protein